jgi:hypothetical protein
MHFHPLYRLRQSLPYVESFLAGFGAGVLFAVAVNGLWYG